MHEPNTRTDPIRDGRTTKRPLEIPVDDLVLEGDWNRPANPIGMVLFAHGSGRSRFSPRNRAVARTLQDTGIATLLFDLLTPAEETQDATSGRWRFDVDLLAHRLVGVTRWMRGQPFAAGLALGYFGASTGAAAALEAAAKLGPLVQAVVSRGGRPDFAGDWLPQVVAPTLLIVGARDEGVLQLNQWAFKRLTCEKWLEEVPRATHLFDEEGALDAVATLAATWFRDHFKRSAPAATVAKE